MDVQDWWSGGELVPLELGGAEQGVFVRREGSGPSMTLLHGFPSSSHDWAKIAPALAERYALTLPDLLGFGGSTKPREHRYSLLEQADLVEALWAGEGIKSTVVGARLLGQRRAGAPDAARGRCPRGRCARAPLHERRHLPGPAPAPARAGGPARHGTGAADQRRDERRAVHGGPRADVPGGYDSAADVAGIWESFHLHDGQKNAHVLIRYIEDRRENADLDAGTPDDRCAADFRLGNARPEDVAHWPPLEAPERVVAALLGQRP